MPGEVSPSPWNRPRRDDRDGCDGFFESGGGVKNIVTVVTAVTGSGAKSQGVRVVLPCGNLHPQVCPLDI